VLPVLPLLNQSTAILAALPSAAPTIVGMSIGDLPFDRPN
jgi:hypothetical protein